MDSTLDDIIKANRGNKPPQRDQFASALTTGKAVKKTVTKQARRDVPLDVTLAARHTPTGGHSRQTGRKGSNNSTPDEEQGGEDAPVSTMSFNVLAHKYTDFPALHDLHGTRGIEPLSAKKERYTCSTDTIVSAYDDKKISITCLQEVDYDFLCALQEKAADRFRIYVNISGNCVIFDPRTTPSFTLVSVAICVRLGLPVSNYRCSVQSFPVNKSSKRWVAVQVRRAWFVSVHLKGTSDAAASVALVRDASVQLQLLDRSRAPWVIGGDFNCKDDSDITIMHKVFASDARKVTNRLDTALHWSFTRGLDIDKIWYCGVDLLDTDERQSFVDHRVPVQPWNFKTNTWGSDHIPVYATFRARS